MNYSWTSIPVPALPSPQDPFSKYLTGLMVQKMPFERYFDEKGEQASQAVKRTTRGPYRKYTSEQKRDIIQRILQGATLKSIAQQTHIPKRNLIRWKHQFLQNTNTFITPASPSDESEEFYGGKAFCARKESLETKSSFSQLSIKAEKIEN